MGKKPRQLGKNLCYHIRNQCNNKAFRFEENDDFCKYLALLDEAIQKFSFQIHAYHLMNTHTHLIATTPGPVLLDEIMYYINKEYSLWYNKHYMRSGHFWMGPYKCDVIDSDKYALTCMRYIDRNSLRAGLISNPEKWPWSSYRFYASGEFNPLVSPLPAYLGLANSVEKRKIIYRDFVNTILPSDEKREQQMIRSYLNRKRLKDKNKNRTGKNR